MCYFNVAAVDCIYLLPSQAVGRCDLAVGIGTQLLGIVPGRVSTECDAHLSYDTQGTIDKVGSAFSPGLAGTQYWGTT